MSGAVYYIFVVSKGNSKKLLNKWTCILFWRKNMFVLQWMLKQAQQ